MAFNRAIGEGDASAIGPILARDCVMVTGTDSAVIVGRMAQVKVWRREFSLADRLLYIRDVGQVVLSATEPLAMETGTWRGMSRNDDVLAAGTYSAKWREVSGEWVIEAEIFVTLS